MEEKINNLGSFQQATGRLLFNAGLVNCFYQFKGAVLRRWQRLFNSQSLALLTKNSSLKFPQKSEKTIDFFCFIE
jgi:hypothetical protein